MILSLARLTALPGRSGGRPDFWALLALLGGHHVDVPRYKGHLRAAALGTLGLNGFMLGNGLSAFKLLPAVIAAILVGWHGSTPRRERRQRAVRLLFGSGPTPQGVGPRILIKTTPASVANF